MNHINDVNGWKYEQIAIWGTTLNEFDSTQFVFLAIYFCIIYIGFYDAYQ